MTVAYPGWRATPETRPTPPPLRSRSSWPTNGNTTAWRARPHATPDGWSARCGHQTVSSRNPPREQDGETFLRRSRADNPRTNGGRKRGHHRRLRRCPRRAIAAASALQANLRSAGEPTRLLTAPSLLGLGARVGHRPRVPSRAVDTDQFDARRRALRSITLACLSGGAWRPYGGHAATPLSLPNLVLPASPIGTVAPLH